MNYAVIQVEILLQRTCILEFPFLLSFLKSASYGFARKVTKTKASAQPVSIPLIEVIDFLLRS